MRFLEVYRPSVGDDDKGWEAFVRRLEGLVLRGESYGLVRDAENDAFHGVVRLPDSVSLEAECTPFDTIVRVGGVEYARIGHPYGDWHCAPTITISDWEPPAWLEVA